MTCIVAISHDDGVYMGGERGNSDSHSIVSSTRPKISRSGEYVIGYAGNSGIGQAIAYNFTPPTISSEIMDEHMLKFFIPALRSFLKNSDINLPDSEDNHADMLVGVRNRVYEISTYDFQCVEYDEIATGSGASYALGSLHSSKHLPPSDRVRLALDSAVTFSPTCQGPIDVLSNFP